MLCIFEAGVLLLPIHYAVTPEGNYSDGIHANLCYVGVGFYLILCVVKMLRHFRHIRTVSTGAICVALLIELIVSLIQGAHPAWLISGIGITLITLTFYLSLENPEKLRAELNEQKMSMLYLKSQVNPHFLYNTLDSIRIQAQLNNDDTTAHLLMRLVDFFRLNVRSNDQTVTLEHETELIDAYMELMCYRYPELTYECDVDEELLDCMVPNFILQPLVENSLLHGLKQKGYRGSISVTAHRINDTDLEIVISDTGTGFTEEEKKRTELKLKETYRFKEKNSGNHIGITNVQNRIRLLCGKDYGLSYTDRPGGGVSAHIVLPFWEEENIV